MVDAWLCAWIARSGSTIWMHKQHVYCESVQRTHKSKKGLPFGRNMDETRTLSTTSATGKAMMNLLSLNTLANTMMLCV
eukprot:9177-Heterococcus_DN1.PRE.3